MIAPTDYGVFPSPKRLDGGKDGADASATPGMTRRWLETARGAWARQRAARERRRLWRRQVRVLAQLDHRELRDIGVYPGEIESLASELVGCAPPTRRRIQVTA